MTNGFFVGVLWGIPFLGMPPFFLRKKRQTGANQSIPYNSLRTPITAFFVAGDYLYSKCYKSPYS